MRRGERCRALGTASLAASVLGVLTAVSGWVLAISGICLALLGASLEETGTVFGLEITHESAMRTAVVSLWIWAVLTVLRLILDIVVVVLATVTSRVGGAHRLHAAAMIALTALASFLPLLLAAIALACWAVEPLQPVAIVPGFLWMLTAVAAGPLRLVQAVLAILLLRAPRADPAPV